MKNLTLAAVIVMISACSSRNTEKQNTTDATKIEQEIRSANDQLYAGLNAMFTGDLELLNNLWSHSEYI
ncbi:MAG: hypothetical protein JJE22_00730, partial [Bacteroidia bacterium]|nr:hypothetical protein [Bacteroidia bacterium]